MNRYFPMILIVISTLNLGHSLAQSSTHDDFELISQQFSTAQELMLDSVVGQGEYVERSQLEDWLVVQSLNSQRIQSVKESLEQTHGEIISDFREIAINESVLDLELFRDQPDNVAQFCDEIPKGGMLHVHPNGTMDRSTVKGLLSEGNPKIDGLKILKSIDKNEFLIYPPEREFLLSPAMNTSQNGTESRFNDLSQNSQDELMELFFLPRFPSQQPFARFMSFFMVMGIVFDREVRDYNATSDKIYTDFFKRAQQEKVSYVEFTANLTPYKHDFKSFSRKLCGLQRWGHIGRKFNIESRWNVAFYRTSDPVKNEQAMIDWLDFLSDRDAIRAIDCKNGIQGDMPLDLWLVGVDLLADETDTPALDKGQGLYLQVLAGAQSLERPLMATMHAGELGHKNNVRDAMLLGVQRVGHGVNLVEDTIVLEYARQNNLAIETNLVSNLRLGIVSDIQEHPFLDFLRLGLPVSLSTDDEGLFETTMSQECEVAIAGTDIQYSELKAMALNGIQTSFADDFTKQRLSKNLTSRFSRFEKKWLKKYGHSTGAVSNGQ